MEFIGVRVVVIVRLQMETKKITVIHCNRCGFTRSLGEFEIPPSICPACMDGRKENPGQTHYVGDSCPGGHHEDK